MAWVDANAEVQKLKHWELLTGAPSQAGEQLAERVEQMELTHLPCSVVLGTEDYDLQLVELPNVPTSERAAAVKFLLKERLEFHLMILIFSCLMSQTKPIRRQWAMRWRRLERS